HRRGRGRRVVRGGPEPGREGSGEDRGLRRRGPRGLRGAGAIKITHFPRKAGICVIRREEAFTPMRQAGVSAPSQPNSFRTGPDEHGRFGVFGGRFVAETLMPLILDLEKAYGEAKADPAFHAEMAEFRTHYI